VIRRLLGLAMPCRFRLRAVVDDGNQDDSIADLDLLKGDIRNTRNRREASIIEFVHDFLSRHNSIITHSRVSPTLKIFELNEVF
jgi:hypothetical protein